jgi:hypothetical protein
MQTAGEILTQIFTNFHPEVFTQFVEGYKGVSILMLLGFMLHFTPRKWALALQKGVTVSPVLLQALYLIILIFIVIQLKSAGVQPFIYFQF